MMDLICFEYHKDAQDPDEYVDVRNAGAKFFFSCAEVSEARRHVDSAKFLHLRDYESDVGLIHLAAKSGCSFVFATSDLLALPPAACAARLSRMRRLAHDCLALGAGVKISTLAKNQLELRGAHERSAVGMLLGIGRERMSGMLKEEAKTEGEKAQGARARGEKDGPAGARRNGV